MTCKDIIPMRLIEFTSHFKDELSCRVTFKKFREKEGIICKKCGNTTYLKKATTNFTKASPKR